MKYKRIKAHNKSIALTKAKDYGIDTILSLSKRFNMRGHYFYQIGFEEKPKLYKHTIYIKLIYDSERGQSHDCLVEAVFTTVNSNKELDFDKVKRTIMDRFEKEEFTGHKASLKHFILEIPFEYEFGFTDIQEVTVPEEDELEVSKYGYRI